MVTPAGFEPAIFWMRTRYPKPLDDGAELMSLILEEQNLEAGVHQFIGFDWLMQRRAQDYCDATMGPLTGVILAKTDTKYQIE